MSILAGTTVAEFVKFLNARIGAAALGWPVVDHTNLTGYFEFRLILNLKTNPDGVSGTADIDYQSALPAQLGLRLEPAREDCTFVVIDSVRKSAEPCTKGLACNSACIAYNRCMQYTIRGISPEIDAALRARALQDHKSLNETALKALAEGVGLTGTHQKRRDLSDIVGKQKMEKAVLDALAAQDTIDEDAWR